MQQSQLFYENVSLCIIVDLCACGVKFFFTFIHAQYNLFVVTVYSVI